MGDWNRLRDIGKKTPKKLMVAIIDRRGVGMGEKVKGLESTN